MIVDISLGKLPPGPASAEFTAEQLSRIDIFLIKSYGFKMAQQIKIDNKKKKDLIRSILVRELYRTYKYPEAAFQALDFKGKGHVEAIDFTEAKFIYRVPFSKEELRDFLTNETIFKKVANLKIEMFTRFFFPHKLKEGGNEKFDFSDSDESSSPQDYNRGSSMNENTIDTASVLSASKNRDLTLKIKQIEDILKERLSNNWVSVRKAFLDLDQDYDGYITAEDFAKLIGGSSGSSKFDFNLLKMLIKMKNKSLSSQVNYTEFCKWFGCVIEPVEAFYFRHDSMKNPQYEKNQQKTVQQYAVGQKKIREIISNQNLKARFIDKLHHQFKSLQKAFIEMNKTKSGYVHYDEFFDLIVSWGFDANDILIKDLFEWLDFDKDNKISYEDLRSTAGLDLSPMEALYFRQDAKPGKQVTCKYEKCWENNNNNSKSQYCQLHQKILRNLALDKFSNIAQKASDEQWESINSRIIQENYQMTLKDLSSLISKTIGLSLNFKDKESIWESFKVKGHIEDNPDNIDERLVSLQALMNARKQTRLKKINQLLTMEADEEQFAEDLKVKGLEQIDQVFVLKMASVKKAQWGGIWKSIKKIDKDSNGYVTIEELDEIFREWFPVELEGKTLNRYFRKFGSIQNKNLINYKKIKQEINHLILKDDKTDFERRMSIREQMPPTKQVEYPQEGQFDSDDEQLLKIDGQSQLIMDKDNNSSIIPASTKSRKFAMINSRKIKNESRSITPLRVMNQSESKQQQQQQPLPQMNRNTSMQKINDLNLNNDNIEEETSMILNNRNTTPVMMKAYEHSALIRRNKSQMHLGGGPISALSQISVAKSIKFNEDVKVKLAYEWKNIFRGIVSADYEKKGSISIGTFNKVIHQHKVYLSREELRKIEQMYSATNQSNPLACEIDYMKISQELGLHKQSLDFIKPKTQKFMDQIAKIRDTPSKGSLRSQLNKSLISYPMTERDKTSFMNNPQSQQKVKGAQEFLLSYDKSRTGQVPLANFLKILRIFGLSVNQSQIKSNEVGMVDYDKALEAIMA